MKTNKRVAAVTGGFSSGKSTVARFLITSKSALIDADKLAHRLLRPKTKVYQRLVHAFGKGILNAKGKIERGRLAEIVFNDRGCLKELNRIIHPQLIKQIKERISSCSKDLIILDAPLLVEAGLLGMADKLVVVSCDRRQQIERAKKKFGLSRKQIAGRLRFQIPQSAKERLADFIIDNRGSLSQTKKQAVQIRRRLWKS